jgi:FemAB-related protein (PEP-CTERM system-associated)
MKMPVEIHRFSDGDEAAWNEYVRRSINAGQSHLAEWRRVVKSAYGHQSHYLLAQAKGRTEGILPLIFIRSAIFGRTLVSMPFLDDGGIVADSDEAAEKLLSKALTLYEELGADSLDLRHRELTGLDIPQNGDKVTFLLDLDPDSSRIWKGFNPKLRNQIRKAMKSDISVVRGGEDLLCDFYEVFSVNMRDLGSPVHSADFFRAILKEFSETAHLILLYKDDIPIGGGFCLSHKNTLIMPWASSLRSHFSLCPNNLLYWEAIRWACDQKIKCFDFGRSSVGVGTYHFKRQWGTREVPLHWQGVNKKRRSSGVKLTEKPKFQWATGIWRRIPLAVTKWVGPYLRGRISN